MSMADSSSATMNEDPAPLYFDSYAIVGPRERKVEDLIGTLLECVAVSVKP